MASCFDIPARFALAVLGIALLLAFAPSNASAHGSHHVHPSTVTHVDSPAVSQATPSAEKRVVEVSAAPIPLAADHVGHSDCGDRGCCANGHCGSFCGVIAPSSFAIFVKSDAAFQRSRDLSLPLGLATDGPARPPRTFA